MSTGDNKDLLRAGATTPAVDWISSPKRTRTCKWQHRGVPFAELIAERAGRGRKMFQLLIKKVVSATCKHLSSTIANCDGYMALCDAPAAHLAGAQLRR